MREARRLESEPKAETARSASVETKKKHGSPVGWDQGNQVIYADGRV